MARSSARNRRDTPYILDRAFVTMHRSAAGVIWRFRTEVAALLTAVTGIWELDRAVTATWAVVIITASVAVLLVLPRTRREVIGRAWCVLSRHRHPAGVFRDPDAHQVRAAAAGAAHLPHPGGGTRGDLVPGRDLRRRFRGRTRRNSPPGAMPARPGSRATGGGPRS